MSRTINWVFPATTALGLAVGVFAMDARAERATAPETPAATRTEGAGTINGELLDQDGKAVAGARVALVKAVGRDQKRQRKDGRRDDAASGPAAATTGKGRARPERVATATTDDDGKFTMSAVPAGEYTVRAQLKGGGTAVARVTVAAGKSADVAMTLKPRSADKGARGKRDLTPEEQAEREQRKQERRQERRAQKKAAKAQL
jgi:protocatechuate 3,4-dioxygenase beta subunit